MICPHSMTHCSGKAESWKRRGGRSAKSESCSLVEEAAAVAAAERPGKTMSAELQNREVCQTWTVECCGAGGGGARCAQWKPLLPSDSTRTDTNYCCLNADEMHWQTTKCPLLAVHYWSLLTRNAADAVAVAVPVEACCCHCCCCPLRILNQMKWQRL